jgi:hypothetical protein
MKVTLDIAVQLADENFLFITQKLKLVDPHNFRGPIRLVLRHSTTSTSTTSSRNSPSPPDAAAASRSPPNKRKRRATMGRKCGAGTSHDG